MSVNSSKLRGMTAACCVLRGAGRHPGALLGGVGVLPPIAWGWCLLLRAPSLAALCFSLLGLWLSTDWLALTSAAQQGSLSYPSFCAACDLLPLWCSYGVPVLLFSTPSGKLNTHTLHRCKHAMSIATDLHET